MENADWPTVNVPNPIKQLISRFYELVDSQEPDCSQRLAAEVFTYDGTFVINQRTMKGSEGS